MAPIRHWHRAGALPESMHSWTGLFPTFAASWSKEPPELSGGSDTTASSPTCGRTTPCFAHNSEKIPLADLVPGIARGHASGRMPSADDKQARTAAAVIRGLNGTDEETFVEDEPLFEVEDLGKDELRGREIELSLREDIAHEYSRKVDWMAKILAKEDGITGVVREDREVLLVATSSWDSINSNIGASAISRGRFMTRTCAAERAITPLNQHQAALKPRSPPR